MNDEHRYMMSRALREAYRRGEDDELLEPLIRVDRLNRPAGRIGRGDAVIFYNIRGEREVELTRSLVEREFDKFPVAGNLDLTFVTMVEYAHLPGVAVAFRRSEEIRDTLTETLSGAGKSQIKITESEKAIHVSFFLNGKREMSFPGEERVIVPTRKDVALFDEAPEMSIHAVADAACRAVNDASYDFIVVNFPNVDVVGHIDNERAVIAAVEAVDAAMGRVVREAEKEGCTVVITADHGTVEEWRYPDGTVNTGHTASPVPLLLVRKGNETGLCPKGELADVAPTVLSLMGIEKPAAMTGTSLLSRAGGVRDRRIVLLILDGWGLREEYEGNLIRKARTPEMDKLMSRHPSARLDASGPAVGLPDGTVGNSEVGHLHLGAGRRIYSDRMRIDRAIADGSFFANDVLRNVMDGVSRSGAPLHLMGIVSFFSSHGSVEHLRALMEMAKRHEVEHCYIHAMLGRRGERPESGAEYIEKVERACEELKLGTVASIIGRYWSLDREDNWDRIEKTYRMLIQGEGRHVREEGST